MYELFFNGGRARLVSIENSRERGGGLPANVRNVRTFLKTLEMYEINSIDIERIESNRN